LPIKKREIFKKAVGFLDGISLYNDNFMTSFFNLIVDIRHLGSLMGIQGVAVEWGTTGIFSEFSV
jgi:hypothetical protein